MPNVFPLIPVIDAGDATTLPISPTEITQYTRLEHCERFLRLRLHERGGSTRFMETYDVSRQAIPPIFTRSGRAFEQRIEREIGANLLLFEFREERELRGGESQDNERLLDLIADLQPGAIAVVSQARIEATLGRWNVRGDADLIRLERTQDGALQIFVTDIKSSAATKVEHRLQVAFYHEMLVAILTAAGIAHERIEITVLYRGPAEDDAPAGVDSGLDDERAKRLAQRADAFATFATSEGLLERIEDADIYRQSVHDLVLGEQSTARRVLATPFEAIPFHIAPKCDDCPFNEFCMKRSAETDNLSLLPHITQQEKGALQEAGIATIAELAALKNLRRKGTIMVDGDVQEHTELVPVPGRETLSRTLAATWPIGPRLDTLIHRAKRQGKYTTDDPKTLTYIPSAGYGSLPYSDAGQNPNLVRVFIDVQHDVLNDRLALAAALVAGNTQGVPDPKRRRVLVRLAQHPPATPEIEQDMLVEWVQETIRAIVEIAAPNADGEPKAPIHLIFYNATAQKALLNALGRHTTSIFGATALYDFVTQVAAYDSPVVTVLEVQIRDRRTYPMTCQSLQSVAAFLKFDWNAGEPYRQLFRARLFDYPGRWADPESGERSGEWYTRRARFNSQVPLEYTYSAWNDLPDPPARGNDPFGDYRHVDAGLLTGFFARRLDAMELVANDLEGNRQTTQAEFTLPDLAAFERKATSFAHAVAEFITIERHVELAGWKAGRLPAPEQRVLGGETLIVRYLEEDQADGVAGRNRDNAQRRQLSERYRREYREQHPNAKQVRLGKEKNAEVAWRQDDIVFRLRIETANLACDLEEALTLTSLKDGERLVMMPRLTTDSRLPAAEQREFTPTARQVLRGMRVTLHHLEAERDHAGRAVRAWAHLRIASSRGVQLGAFAFPAIDYRPLIPGEVLTLDPNPDSYPAYWQSKVAEGLIAGHQHTLYRQMTADDRPGTTWPDPAREAQTRFLAGLDALRAAGALHGFEPGKQEFIGSHGDTPLLLVQGPPGTGKSFTTAFAILARVQGAMAANIPYRVAISCKTHAATDVLLDNLWERQHDLRRWAADHPDVFAEHFDARLLDLPLMRVRPPEPVKDDIIPIPKDDERPGGAGPPRAWERITAEPWAVVAATPGGIYGVVKDRFGTKDLFGHHAIDCLVLDEASQMNIPEAMIAALPLAPDGRLVVVGDHRQMPPIVRNDWENDTRRTFQEFRTYESLFLALRDLNPPIIRFEESFRLHADMAEFLRHEIYRHDGINYHSNRYDLLEPREIADPFVSAVLAPSHPIVVVVHDEARSQVRNAYEQHLMTPVLEMLAADHGYALDAEDGLGVVVPHRAQRAALQEAIPALSVRDPDTGTVTLSAVNTVERFQGDERVVVLYGATESDRAYLQSASKFLMEPRRLTVALSRAKRKLVLVASRSVFEIFSADEETFANAQLWKNLLRRTCTVPLWAGERSGHQVEVWGNQPASSR